MTPRGIVPVRYAEFQFQTGYNGISRWYRRTRAESLQAFPSALRLNSIQKGKYFEEKAAIYLQSLGFRIIERNWRSKKFEIDILAQLKSTLIFVEVRSRSTRCFSSLHSPWDSFPITKQRKFFEAVRFYIDTQKPVAQEIRLDYIFIRGKLISHFPGIEFCDQRFGDGADQGEILAPPLL